jgi:T-complex protein 1 subunit theta
MSINQLLKEGTKYLSGVDEAILKNIEAVKELSDITKTSLGPNGMNKMIINKLEKLMVTSDAATIIKELEVVHPAAKLVVMASEQQESEVGDATNLVVIITGELLSQAESLLRMGLHASDIVQGYERAIEKTKELLNNIIVKNVKNLRDEKEVMDVLRGPIDAKQYGYESTLVPLVAKACIQVLPKNVKAFDVDNIRVVKVLGSGVGDSRIVKGAVIKGDSEGSIKFKKNAKVAVYAGGIDDITKTDSQSTVLVTTPEELKNYNISEEKLLEEKIKRIAESGVDVVVSGGNIGELVMHFMEKYNIMVIRTQSKFDVRRICLATNARALVRLDAPRPEEMGLIDSVRVVELGSTSLVYFEREKEECRIATILVRGASDNILDDVERAIDDGVKTFKTITKLADTEISFVPGCGASELELARLIKNFGETVTGQDQYAVVKFGEALEIVPKILAENAGMNPTEILSNLYAAHSKGDVNFGVDILGTIADSVQLGIYDLLTAKRRAFELATNAAVTILKLSQIIMAKQSDMPKPPGQSGATMGQSDTDPF